MATSQQVTLALTGSCLAAIQVLRDMLVNGRTESAKIRAALGILNQAKDWSDGEVLARLEEMESAFHRAAASSGVVVNMAAVGGRSSSG
jgi:isocitrate dehydrogenase kinase/phosphatase